MHRTEITTEKEREIEADRQTDDVSKNPPGSICFFDLSHTDDTENTTGHQPAARLRDASETRKLTKKKVRIPADEGGGRRWR